jgi:hypothetical protein
MSEQADLLSPAKPPVALNTPHARDMLHKRYPSPEWALLEEVAPATGGGTRYADAVAVNLWQSRGHAVHGFEIKVSRSDWLRELKDPSKAEPVYRYCDYWWIVAPRGIVKDGELPPTWGLLELRASGLVQAVNAPKLEAQPINRAFFASLMRRGYEQLDRLAELKQQRAVAEARSDVERQVREGIERASKHHKEMQEQIAKFKAETGLEFSRWSGPPIEAIKLAQRIQKLGFYGDRAFTHLTGIAAQMESAAANLRKAVDETGLMSTDPSDDLN